MAAKAATKRTARPGEAGWLAQAATTFQRMRSAEGINSEVVQLRKAVEQRWTRLARGLQRESSELARAVEKQLRRELRRLRGQVEPLVKPLEHNMSRALRELRSQVVQAERAARRAGHRLLVQQFELAPRRDLEQLRQRVTDLEKQLRRLAKTQRETAEPPATAANA